MPRRKIIDLPGAIQFVTFSTHHRRQFLSPDRTRSIVIETLQTCLERHNASCFGFVIMPNHVHALLSVPEESTIAAFLMPWKKTSSYRIKRFYDQELTKYRDLCPANSPIWQESFYSFLVEATKFNEKLQYMHDNPVSAGLCETMLDWKWSSARFYELSEHIGVKITQLL